MTRVPNLKAWRARHVLTMRELAEKSGVSLDTINRLEQGGEAQPRTVRKIAAALGMSPELLVSDGPTVADV